MANLIHYTVGFMFSEDLRTVLLISKERPAWQKGKLNGIGGKVNIGESPVQAMVREFKEETGLVTTKDDWSLFHYERHPSGTVLHFYVAQAPLAVLEARESLTDEVVELWSADLHINLDRKDFSVYNLPYLLPMALSWIQHPEHRYLEG